MHLGHVLGSSWSGCHIPIGIVMVLVPSAVMQFWHVAFRYCMQQDLDPLQLSDISRAALL